MVDAGLAGRRRRLAALGLIALAFVSGFVLVYVLTVRTVRGRLFGDASLRGALATNSAVASTVDGVLDAVSLVSLVGAIAIVAVIALVRLDRVGGLAALGIIVGANLSAWLLKDHLLARPDLGVGEVAPATLNSLPSGHTTAAFSAVAALVFVLPRRWRLLSATTGAGFATLTALATMSSGWHRAADSVTAFLLVGAWTCAAAAAVVIAERPGAARDELRWPGARSYRWWSAGAVGLLIVGAGIALGVDALGFLRDMTLGWLLAFLAGALLIGGTICAVLVGVLAALDLRDDDVSLTRP